MITKENIIFSSHSVNLAATCFWPTLNEKAPAIIICHGAGDFKENFFPLAQFLTEHGFAVLCIDMYGHGQSQGARFNVLMKEWTLNVQSAIDFLGQHPKVDAARIGAFGLSSGGTAILEVATIDHRLAALVTLDATVRNTLPFFLGMFFRIFILCGALKKSITGRDLHIPLAKLSGGIHLASDPIVDAQIQARPEFKSVFNAFPFPGGAQAFFVDTIKRVGAIITPTMVIWGEDDQTDSPETAKLLCAALKCKKELHIVPGNGHMGHLDRNKATVFDLTLRWFLENLK